MTLSLGVFIVVVLIFAIQGLRKGFFGALGGILSLVAGYAAAIYGLKPLAKLLKDMTGLDGLLLYFSAGLIAFIVASLVVGIVFSFLERAISATAGLSGMSRLGGMLVGTGVGCILGLLVVYGISIYQELQHPDKFDNDTFLAQKTRGLMSHATASILEHTYPEAKSLAVAFVEDPVEMGEHLNQVLSNDAFKQLLQDPQFQLQLEQGNTPALLQNPDFQQLARDEHLQQLLQHSDIAHTENTDEVLATHMSNVWQKVQRKKNDERVQAILKDPALQQKLQNNDRMALLRDPQLLELMELLFTEESTGKE
ncbi:CvpA family protein [Cellvibrio sp. ARAG 10.3]|uniref:CvpA family protein n=1 Tax=Cellvibrio sp. ARAG 10.3 TaxID=3451358 RepID=UPI003F48953F